MAVRHFICSLVPNKERIAQAVPFLDPSEARRDHGIAADTRLHRIAWDQVQAKERASQPETQRFASPRSEPKEIHGIAIKPSLNDLFLERQGFVIFDEFLEGCTEDMA